MIGNKKRIIDYLSQQSDKKIWELNEKSEKRTNRANRYYWTLINDLADTLRISKNELHLRMLKDYGSSDIIYLKSEIKIRQYVKYFEKMSEFEKNGNKFTEYKVYVPSSEMNKKQFSILLNGLVQECREQNIPTLEDNDLKEIIRNYEIK